MGVASTCGDAERSGVDVGMAEGMWGLGRGVHVGVEHWGSIGVHG